MPSTTESTVLREVLATAVKAHRAGWTPIPIQSSGKRPATTGWTKLKFESSDEVKARFTEWYEQGHTNVGVLLGERSSNLVDIDLDHPTVNRLKRHFLPPTDMVTGRPGNPASHWWYQVEEGTLPSSRRHMMPDGAMAVEFRSNKAQTLLPPSTHPSGEQYMWHGAEFGTPTRIDGQLLATQVALLALGTVLIDAWPTQGGRHEAYLALAGGMLRNTDGSVHPFWENNLPVLISALADATHDDDGADTRVAEVMESTLRRIRTGDTVQGFGKLGEIIGKDSAKQARLLLREVESSAGYTSRDNTDVAHAGDAAGGSTDMSMEERLSHHEDEVGGLEADERDPLNERLASWQPVDLEPYLLGEVKMQEPDVLAREDGVHLMYRGRVNMLFGSSESAKSWIALQTSLQEMSKGERVVYLDFEDEPISTLDRLQRLGAGHDDIRTQFTYIRPEEPLAPMQRNRWGSDSTTQKGLDNQALFEHALDSVDPSLIIADGMTVLYGLHGLDSNDSVSTDVITTWLKKLTRNGRSTVIVIDHAAKSSQKGAMPIGSQHKVAMVQGTLFQVWPLKQPMPGRVGEVELVVVKDRPGQVRAVSEEAPNSEKAQVSARILMDSTTENETRMTIHRPTPPKPGEVDLSGSEAASKAEDAAEWDSRVLHAYGGELGKGMNVPDLMDELAWYHPEARAIRATLKRLVSRGWLEKRGSGPRNTKWYLLTGKAGYEDPREEYEDDDEDGA